MYSWKKWHSSKVYNLTLNKFSQAYIMLVQVCVWYFKIMIQIKYIYVLCCYIYYIFLIFLYNMLSITS